ncbi:MAG TPA: flagellar biosynthesis protein FlhB [Lachnoclostridium phytofermentans]|uniref:Flagellar biosynthesis protein FlhB n=1 Tax=Lachnoclostridium phytofermentans TaxID=66219 RepID=A0A3D2X3W9_9FIRM|nr:flagellar biosynthesis protein FlhB [Lachnoclostridium phytofermentans]
MYTICGNEVTVDKEKKTAVALSYNPKDPAPRIIASGKNILADKIIKKAMEEDIPIHKDVPLANTLSKLELGDCIPPELYDIVAQVLLFVDRMDLIKGRVMGEVPSE